MNLIVLPLSAYPHQMNYSPYSVLRGATILMFCIGLPISLILKRYSNRVEPLQNSKILIGHSTQVFLLIAFLLSCSSYSFASEAAKATFAGGCYWCMEEAFERVEGVTNVTSGFVGPVEAVEVTYDPTRIEYKGLLEAFWKNIDPADSEGQFCDRGFRYSSAIFFHSEQQRLAAEESKKEIAIRLKTEPVTPVVPAKEFKPVAEDQQDYYKKHGFQYKQYKIQCGRDRRLRSIWKK
jgi:peptide-methionine (S)-S-oxide reductase